VTIQNKNLTSVGAKIALDPKLSLIFWPSELGRSQMTTLAPFLMNLSEVARPKPEAPPVTRVTRPYNII